MTSVVRRYPVASYFALAFGISWALVLFAIAPGAIPGSPQDVEHGFALAFLAMLAGPSIAGVLVATICEGRRALGDYRRRLLTWRVSVRYYAIALLTAPLALCVTLLILSAFVAGLVPGFLGGAAELGGPVRAASPMTFVLLCAAVGLGAGFFEEIGWTGFALPRLRSRFGVVAAATILGIAWGAWHFLAILWGSGTSFGTVPVPLFLLVALFSFLPPYRVLMALVYDRTGSLLVAVVMHTSLTSSMLILGPHIAGTTLIAYDLVFAAVLWAVVGVAVAVVRPARQAPQTLAVPSLS
jgi:membrane protease YdiL (CAAX protease family)